MSNARYAMQCKICNARSAMQVLGFKLMLFVVVISYHVTSFRIVISNRNKCYLELAYLGPQPCIHQ